MSSSLSKNIFSWNLGCRYRSLNGEQVADSRTNVRDCCRIQALRELYPRCGNEAVEEVKTPAASGLLFLMKAAVKLGDVSTAYDGANRKASLTVRLETPVEQS